MTALSLPAVAVTVIVVAVRPRVLHQLEQDLREIRRFVTQERGVGNGGNGSYEYRGGRAKMSMLDQSHGASGETLL